MIKLLYKSNVLALALHFIVNAFIASLFALLFTYQLDLGPKGARVVLALMEVTFLVYSVQTLVSVPTLHGYLLNFLGTNTHIVLPNGMWPMFLYPMFKVEAHEEVDFQLEAAKISETIVTDQDTYTFKLSGTIPYHIESADASRFTMSDMKAFMDILTASGLNAGITTFNTHKYLDPNSIIKDLKKFNQNVLSGIDTVMLHARYGITIDTPLLTYTATEETRKNFETKTAAASKAAANKNLGVGFADLIIEYKKKLIDAGLTCSDDEARRAVNEALNGKTIYDFGDGGSGGNAVRLLNISPTTK